MAVAVMKRDSEYYEIMKWSVVLAIITHQVFRRYETFRISVHLCLLLGPPFFVAAYAYVYVHPVSANTYTLPKTLLTCFETYLSALVIFILVYRLSPIHPIARYPGPLWRRISMFPPTILAVITGDSSKHIQDLHKRYGDVVRTGPNELSIIDPTYIPLLLGAGGVPKGPGYTGGALSEENVSMVGIMDIDEHMRRRRTWNRGFSQSALKEYEPLVVARTQQLVQRLREQSGEVVLGSWFSYFSFDVMSDMAFGGGSELLRGGDDKNNVWSTIEEGLVIVSGLFHIPWLGIYMGKIPWAVRPVSILLSRSRELVTMRLDRGPTRPDLFHYLNNEDLPGTEPPPTRQLVNDGVLAIVAGSDTTSLTLNSLFYCIMTHPETYAALQAEVDRFYPAGENVFDTRHHRDMHYLQAVINETLRLFPPTPGGGQRKVPDGADPVVVGSLYLPPGTVFYMPLWSLHRDARNFVFPTAFWPERWLIAAGHLRLADAALPHISVADERKGDATPDPAAFVHNEIAFLPFSYGPMNCPGKGLAMLEVRMVVCALMQRFRIRLREGWDPRAYEREYKDYFTGTRPEVPATLEVR